jgi:hypothetical protein
MVCRLNVPVSRSKLTLGYLRGNMNTKVSITYKVCASYEVSTSLFSHNYIVSSLNTDPQHEEVISVGQLFRGIISRFFYRAAETPFEKCRRTITMRQAGPRLHSRPAYSSFLLMLRKSLELYKVLHPNTIQAFWFIQSSKACSRAILIFPFFIPSFRFTASLNRLSKSSSIFRPICPINFYYVSYLVIKLSVYLVNHKLFIILTR